MSKNHFGEDFKKFLMRGNVIDLAVGVVIGAAFGKIVSSFVTDMLMPPIGLLLGKVDFSNLFFDLSGQGYPSVAAAKQAGAPTLNYGLFLNSVLDFVIIAFSVFLVVRLANSLHAPKQEAAPAAPAEPSLTDKTLLEIRDLLRQTSSPQASFPSQKEHTVPQHSELI